jgi:hypothetical protein
MHVHGYCLVSLLKISAVFFLHLPVSCSRGLGGLGPPLKGFPDLCSVYSWGSRCSVIEGFRLQQSSCWTTIGAARP